MKNETPKLPIVGRVGTLADLMLQTNSVQKEMSRLFGFTTYVQKKPDGTSVEVDVRPISFKPECVIEKVYVLGTKVSTTPFENSTPLYISNCAQTQKQMQELYENQQNSLKTKKN